MKRLKKAWHDEKIVNASSREPLLCLKVSESPRINPELRKKGILAKEWTEGLKINA